MYTIKRTDQFVRWYETLRDRVAIARIAMRLDRVESGNLGDWKSVGEGVRELRIDHGPGYRIYFGVQEQTIVILLCGRTKRSQSDDIAAAHAMWKRWTDEP
jgi:putative addiction module killer protein